MSVILLDLFVAYLLYLAVRRFAVKSAFGHVVLFGILLTLTAVAIPFVSALLAAGRLHHERQAQRAAVPERIAQAGGWPVRQADCDAFVAKYRDSMFLWHRWDTNTLPPSLAALKPWAISFYSPTITKEFKDEPQVPAWCRSAALTVNGNKLVAKPAADGYVAIPRTWKSGDKVELNLPLEPRLVIGDHHNQGKVALEYGPLALCADEALLPDIVKSLAALTIANPDLAALGVNPEPAPQQVKTWPGAQVFRIKTQDRKTGAPVAVRLIPFADAGGTGTGYKVWLPLPRQASGNLLVDGLESRSRPGNQPGSIIDEAFQGPVVTFDNQPAKEDWFAVTLEAPIQIRRVVFVHGQNFHDGGWFDASASKPQVQIQREKNGAWETIGELADYPATTASNNASLKLGQAFTLKLASPVQARAVRVLGVPACGDNPKQNFASCAEMQAFDP